LVHDVGSFRDSIKMFGTFLNEGSSNECVYYSEDGYVMIEAATLLSCDIYIGSFTFSSYQNKSCCYERNGCAGACVV